MPVTQGAECYLAIAAVLQHHASSRDTPLTRIPLLGVYVPAVSPYLSQKLTRILVTKDGGTPRTIQEGCAEPRPSTHNDDQNHHWRSIRPKATNMTMPVIIPTSSAAVIISIISSAPSRQTIGSLVT